MTRFKICCIADVDEMRRAIAVGASAIGLVAAMPSGPGVIGEDQIARIAAATPPGVGTFLLTSHQRAADVIAQHRRCRTTAIQLCDSLTEGTHADLRAALPGVRLVHVIHIARLDAGPDAIAEATRTAPHVDALLLDSGVPTASTKILGGTGRTHDWDTSRRIVEAVAPCRVFLAGGLRAENAPEAIRTVQPYALDLCTGVRTAGLLDDAKLSAFAEAVHSAQSLQATQAVR